jgi:hypothetical protein
MYFSVSVSVFSSPSLQKDLPSSLITSSLIPSPPCLPGFYLPRTEHHPIADRGTAQGGQAGAGPQVLKGKLGDNVIGVGLLGAARDALRMRARLPPACPLPRVRCRPALPAECAPQSRWRPAPCRGRWRRPGP